MTDRVEPPLTKGGGGPDADEVAEEGDTGVAGPPPRYEKTPGGDQAVVPGTPTRAIPTGPTSAQAPQKDIDETPLFGQDRVARKRAGQETQGDLGFVESQDSHPAASGVVQ